MEGNLFKWINFIKGWKQRYFSIENHILYYSDEKNDPNKKAIQLKLAKLISDDNNKKCFSISIGKKTIYLKTDTLEETAKWTYFIERGISISNELENFKDQLNTKDEDEIINDLSFESLDQDQEYDKSRRRTVNNYNFDKDVDGKLKEFTKLIQCLQKLYFNFSIELGKMNSDINQNEKEHSWAKNYYFNLLTIKQELKDYIDQGYTNIVKLRESFVDSSVNKLNSSVNLVNFDKIYSISDNHDIQKNEFKRNSCHLKSLKLDSVIKQGNMIKQKEKLNNNIEINDNQLKSDDRMNNKIVDSNHFKESKISLETKYNDNLYNTRRDNLPEKIRVSNSMFSEIIKSIAKDKIELPIHHNEPLSMLQKLCEKFQYAPLLNIASTNQNPYFQLAYIAGFLMGEVSLNINRVLKPFNPILGETFEFIDNQNKFRYFSEQVSHHPPISAFNCESEKFVIFGDSRCTNKFKFLKGEIELNFTNKTHVILKTTNNYHFTYNKPKICLKGLLLGKPQYDFIGEVQITNHTSNDYLILEFFEDGKLNCPKGHIEGKVFDKNKNIKYYLKGSWLSSLYLIQVENENDLKKLDYDYLEKNKIKLELIDDLINQGGIKVYEIWKIIEDEFWKQGNLDDYKLSKYACNLNYLDENLKKVLPPTDSRLRPDQRALENQKMEIARSEKLRIEDIQRKRNLPDGQLNSKYFCEVLDSFTNEKIFKYNGDYWGRRENKKFEDVYDIFSSKL